MKSYISAFALVAALTGASKSRPAQSYGGHGHGHGYGKKSVAVYGNGYGNNGYGNGYNNGYGGYDGGYGNGYNNGYAAKGAYNDGYGAQRGYDGYGNGYNAGYGDYDGLNGYGAYDEYGSLGPSPVHKRHISQNRKYIPHNSGYGTDYGLWNRSYKVEDEAFEQVVIKDVENIWIVAYIDPACGACKKFSIEWEKLRTVETIKYKKVKLGYVDVTVEGSRKIVGKYTQGKDVTGTPTLFVYGNEKMAPIEFKGDLTSKTINQYLIDYAETNGYDYTTDADVDNNHEKAKAIGSEAALPTKGPIKIIGATKIQNR